jgi:DNA-binding winged helix-turn-helix (wHTH) protein
MSKSFGNSKRLQRILEGIAAHPMLMMASELYFFGSYSLDLRSRTLRRSHEIVTLAPKTFDLLTLLVRSNGHLLSKGELMASLWPQTFVEEANLSFQISALRKALGDEGTEWIETVPKHGYRFKAEGGACDEG